MQDQAMLAFWDGRRVFEEDRIMRLALPQEVLVHFARIGFSFFSLCWLMLVDPRVTAGQTSSCRGIHVTILNIRNGIGTVDCALFDSASGFPREVLHSAMRLVIMKVPNSEARCEFEGISAGTYALVVLHDENMNGKIDTNWAGVPKDGYGFSNDAKAAFRAPSFSDSSFVYDGTTLDLTITLRY
jgi:uncharacterized protein (DUF2141 family)